MVFLINPFNQSIGRYQEVTLNEQRHQSEKIRIRKRNDRNNITQEKYNAGTLIEDWKDDLANTERNTKLKYKRKGLTIRHR